MAEVSRKSKNSQKFAFDFSAHHSACGSRHWLFIPGSKKRQFRQTFRSEWQYGQESSRAIAAASVSSRLQWWQTFTWPSAFLRDRNSGPALRGGGDGLPLGARARGQDGRDQGQREQDV